MLRSDAARASDRPHHERFPTLCDSNGAENRVGGSCRASFHPLGLPVCVASQSSGCRVFSCASPTCLRTSKPLGSLHVAAYSRSAGPSKVEIPSAAIAASSASPPSDPVEFYKPRPPCSISLWYGCWLHRARRRYHGEFTRQSY